MSKLLGDSQLEGTGDKRTKFSKYQWSTLWASGIGYAMDGLDMMILSFTLPLLITAFSLNAVEAGSISTITMLGAVIGGILFGILSDMYGRVRVFTWSILIFAFFTGLCAISGNLTWFIIFRFLSGLGLGGEFGIGMTLVSETWPKKYRSRATSGVAVGYQVGIVLATLVTAIVAPYFGWRGVFLIGVVPAILAWWSRRNLKEPEVWVKSKASREKQKKSRVPIKEFFNTPKIAGTTIGLIILTGVQNFGFYGLMTWAPTMLSKQLGFSVNGTTVWTIVTTIGMIVGIVLFGLLADKWGRKPSFLIFQIGCAVMIWVFFQLTIPALVIVLGALLGFFVNGMMGGYGAVLAEHYSTEVRSTAENFIFNIGRAIGGFGPLVIGYLSLHHSLSYALGFLSVIYIIDILAVIFLIPETKGKEIT